MTPPLFTLVFLGTSAGVPTRERNVTALAVQSVPGAGWLLVDCGEGTQQQLLRARLPVRELAAVCITHAHGDHCYGLPGLLESVGIAGRTAPLTLMAPLPVWQWLQATRKLTDAPVPYEVRFIEAGGWDWQGPSATLRIERHALLHRVPSHAFRIEATQTRVRLNTQALRATGLPPGPAWRALHDGHDVPFEGAQGALLRSADFTETQIQRGCIVVGGDNADPTLLRAACADAQLLVHEATFTQDVLNMDRQQWMHSSAQMVADFAESAGVPHLILTHLSARYHGPGGQALLRNEAAARYHGALWIANDLDVFTLDAEGKVRLE
ncbi:MAG: ribonuclease Z [Burkholderiaceae bacterium]|jgi:ribonuclease Z|nr:ribonuclease Z [Burkholderiaceae bacterium]